MLYEHRFYGGGLLLQFFMLYEHRFYGGGLLLQFFMLCEHGDWRGRQPIILYALRAWDLWGGSCYNSLCSTSIGIGGGDSL